MKISTLFRLPNKQLIFWALFVVVLLVGCVLRFYALRACPCGLAPDEAYNATIAQAYGARFVYPTPLSEVEGFFVSLLSIMFRLLGYGVTQVFATSAFVGSITLGFVGVAIRKHFGNWMALFAMGFLAVSPWHIALSHAGTWVVTTPLFLTLLLLAIPKQMSSFRPAQIFGIGAIWGAGFYGYINYRVTLLAGIFMCLFYFVHAHVRAKKREVDIKLFRSLVFLMLGFLVATMPLWAFYIRNPSVAFARISQVNILSWDVIRNVQIIWANSIQQYIGLFIRGSQNWHHALDGDPYIATYLVVPFLIGLFVCSRFFLLYLRGKSVLFEYRYLFPLFFIFLLPDLLTDSPANGGRLSTLLPLVYLVAAIGIVHTVRQYRFRIGVNIQIVFGLLWVLLVGYGAWHSVGLLLRQQYSPIHAKEYFCDARIASRYLDSPIFISSLPTDELVHIYIIGSWYDYAPYDHYLKTSRIHERVEGIDYVYLDDIAQTKYTMHKGDIVVLPAFSSYRYKRIVNEIDKIHTYSGQTVRDVLLRMYPNLTLVFKDTGRNIYWFPDGSSFEVYRYEDK